MFTVSELNEIIQTKAFISDYNWIQQSLVNRRVKQEILFQPDVIEKLDYFVEAVLASCSEWNFNEGSDLCRIAGEIAEILSLYNDYTEDEKKRNRFKSAILYEHAGLPALSDAAIETRDYQSILIDFFKRRGEFQKLNISTNRNNEIEWNDLSLNSFVETIIKRDAYELAKFEQGEISKYEKKYSSWLSELAKIYLMNINASEAKAFSNVISRRIQLATVSNVSIDLFSQLKTINFPAELWPAQLQAIDNGLLDDNYDSWGLASPTGTGKTFLTRLLIINTLKNNPESKILYIVPSRALVYEISSILQTSLKNLNIETLAVNSQLVRFDVESENQFESSSIVVLTPEKADLLLRIGQSTLDEVSHVIIDEAHHIEADTRGVLLELYLWRIKKMIQGKARFIFLSAVAPNIDELTNWVGNNPKSEIVEKRATRMRAGVYKIIKNSLSNRNEGWIEYSDGTRIRLIESNIENTIRRKLAQLAEAIHTDGAVLIVAKGKIECESLATVMLEYLKDNNKLSSLSSNNLSTDEYNRLDSRLEREMYPSVLMRDLLKNRIAYHHAGLPPRVRIALEDLIRKGLIDYVFATTTLAEGVNFPFSSVIVQSLVIKEQPQFGRPVRYRPITPRNFWNIAGRAGRPGFDKEGQVILFEPSLGLEHINAVLSSYLNPNLKDIAPVKSALSESLIELYNNYSDGTLEIDSLNSIELSKSLSRNIKGTINLLRVGLVHAKATELLNSPEEILEGSFANYFMNEKQRSFAKDLINNQSDLLNEFFSSKGAPSEKIVAEMGLSIDTIERLKNYVLKLQDWQIAGFRNLFYGGEANLNAIRYVIGPVSKNIAELEGETLGGYLSEISVKWISGVPLYNIRSELTKYSGRLAGKRLESIISILYSRIQYLLPCGLFAVDTIIEEECKQRNILYNNEVRKLSYLTDSGVPSFDAHRLVNLDFERVDATRLYRSYIEKGGIKLGVDIINWILNESRENLYKSLRGIDNRRIDFDLNNLLRNINPNYEK